MKKKEFPTFRTIKIGTHTTFRGIERAIERRGGSVEHKQCRICYKHDILDRRDLEYGFSRSVKKIELVVLSLAEIGFPACPSPRRIKEHLEDLGLDWCTPEIIFQLRLQYDNQPEGERLFVEMEISPPCFIQGIPIVFGIENKKGSRLLSLSYERISYDYQPADKRYMFVRKAGGKPEW